MNNRLLTTFRICTLFGLAFMANHWLAYCAALIFSFPQILGGVISYIFLVPFFFVTRMINRDSEKKIRESFLRKIADFKQELLSDAKESY